MALPLAKFIRQLIFVSSLLCSCTAFVDRTNRPLCSSCQTTKAKSKFVATLKTVTYRNRATLFRRKSLISAKRSNANK